MILGWNCIHVKSISVAWNLIYCMLQTVLLLWRKITQAVNCATHDLIRKTYLCTNFRARCTTQEDEIMWGLGNELGPVRSSNSVPNAAVWTIFTCFSFLKNTSRCMKSPCSLCACLCVRTFWPTSWISTKFGINIMTLEIPQWHTFQFPETTNSNMPNLRTAKAVATLTTI